MLPEKPLKVLTIDGGGLQAISTLLILDKLLDSIAKTNNVPNRKPRPCDVFDTIAGIGAGGWLAILLGRFHMDITTCLSEWYKITQRIAPRSRSERLKMRTFHNCYFLPENLVEQIESLTKTYGTGEFLFENHPDGIRTRHVFVAALRCDDSGYNLFRSYPIPVDTKLPLKLLPGPENPSNFRISAAFGVTGAAKYFSPPWKEQMTTGRTKFADNNFPNPHNITELVLDEMWGIYGTEVPFSIVVNIGPGLPSKPDVRQIAQRFSWGLNTPSYIKRPRSPNPPVEDSISQPAIVGSITKRSRQKSPLSSPRTSALQFQEHPILRDAPDSTAPKKQLPRSTTFGSIRDRTVGKKLRRLESDIENDVKEKLRRIYPGAGTLYYRLAPEQAPRGTAQNDSSLPGAALDATVQYLEQPTVQIKIDEIAKQLPQVTVLA